MKRVLVLVAFLLSPVLLFAQASISFDSEVFDAGTVASGNPIEHIFIVKNTGDADLVIDRITTS